ncbi:membrane protein implicated in regulation of membrane protease activity [Hylemonella gracilis str. Niagara R]|uniref:Membrane protein implicated in regulation of membrane protease activity n=1 Tax=Hylemonella gracilis str. Niagara R TaxID=1458275 RepID=A0A016XII8_9BURK|nr:NfeD family protein [Hylemonella gracilis]EYC51382.1 membrane protein implicated in regulation of membrane protease activity [Hylemonella gracilis str. Niagara R]
MADSTLWWLATGILVAAELLSGTFYLLMLALGVAAGALATHAGLPASGQITSAALVGALAVLVWYRLRRRARTTSRANANRDVNLDIGETVQVQRWDTDGTARVKYRGASWSAATAHPQEAQTPGLYRIVEVRGNRLLLKRRDDDAPAP